MITFEECKYVIREEDNEPAWERLTADQYERAAKLYARECCQASLNKASESAQPMKYLCDGEWWVNSNGIDKKSIIDSSNIVLL